MNHFQTDLIHEIDKLQYLRQMAEQEIDASPPGRLRIARSNHAEQYYWREKSSDSCGKYIKKKNHKMIHELAQKDYAERILPIIKKHQEKLREAYQVYQPEEMLEVYQNLSESRRKLINPYVVTDEEYVRRWEEQQKTEIAKEDNRFESEIYTEIGEQVRSKSEKILADKLFMMNILYAYEVPLYLNGYGSVIPDFKVLNRRTRNEYYWEHLGMMDFPEYVEKNVKKIETYEKNHTFPGSGLILTYETSKHPLNSRIVEELIRNYLM